MRVYTCPTCGNRVEKGDRTYAVICPCGVYMLENLPRNFGDDVEKNKSEKSPTIIFKGSGWTPKGDKK